MVSLRPLGTGTDPISQTMVATNPYGTFFGISQAVLDQVWTELTAPAGNSVTYISMEIGADGDVFHPIKDAVEKLASKNNQPPLIARFIAKHLRGPEKIPNYSGGLGVLAGDTLKSLADLKIPALGVSLFYKYGYFSQLVDSASGQIAYAAKWDPEETATLYLLHTPNHPEQPLEIAVPFYDRHDQVTLAHAQLWLKLEVNADLDFFTPEILLDFSIDSSPEWIRSSAHRLYDSSSERAKVIQRRLLGAGVVQVLKTLGITSRTIHLNEQHGVVVVLHLIAERMREKLGADYALLATDHDLIQAANQVAEGVIYTIHTPVKAGHDRFEKNLYAEIGHSFCQRILELLAHDQEMESYYNFTALAMAVNRATNSVSRLHKKVTQRQFPQFADKISAITNGVHHLTWISPAKAELYDGFPVLKNWRHDPSVFANAITLLDSQKFRTYLQQTWFYDTQILTSYINAMLIRHRTQMHETWIDPPNFISHLEAKERELVPEIFTIGFARRFSTYKRAGLIFDNIDTLAQMIVANHWPVNFVFAGKAHPADEPGKSVIKSILAIQQDLYEKSNGLAKLIFIPGYDMAIAKMMVAGVHIWLNSPKRPLEASGTSGMKAALNGIPNISTMDGWWVEGYHEGKTGWKFGYESQVETDSLSEDPGALLYREDAASFYQVFPEVLRTFYSPTRNHEYLDKCIHNIALNGPIFNTHRMVAEYVNRYRLDLPAATKTRIANLSTLYQSDAPA